MLDGICVEGKLCAIEVELWVLVSLQTSDTGPLIGRVPYAVGTDLLNQESYHLSVVIQKLSLQSFLQPVASRARNS